MCASVGGLAGGGSLLRHIDELMTQRGYMNRLLGTRWRSFLSESWQLYPIGMLFGLGFDTASEIGLLASVGRAQARVIKRPRVAVFSTGDELVDAGAPLAPGQIRDTNRYSLASALREAGAEAWVRGIVRDSPDALRAALREASAADAIVTSGGVSVGDHDYMKPIMSELGTIDFWAIAIRPGRPLAFGELRDGDRRVPVFGLPGNVVSSLVTFELFVRPALLRMQGRDEVARPRTKARLLEPIEKIASLRVFARGIHDPSAGTVRTTGPQGARVTRPESKSM